MNAKRILHITINNHSDDPVENVMIIQMPLDRKKSQIGFYSSLWRDLKSPLGSILKVDKSFIKAEIKVDRIGDPKNVIVSLPSGFKLTYPEDINQHDVKIILKQLEVLEMSIA